MTSLPLRRGHAGAALMAVLVLLALMLVSPAAHAHTRSQSMSSLSVDGEEIEITFRVPAREVTRLGVLDPQAESLEALLAAHLLKALSVQRGDAPCAMAGAPRPLRASASDIALELRFACPPGTAEAPVAYTNNAFFPIASRHIHFARARAGDGGFEEQLMTATGRTAHFAFTSDGDVAPLQESAGETAWRYIKLGAEHIWIGIDHLAFLVGLLLLCRRLRDVVFVVTGFTIGHSITLTLTVLGLAVPNPPVVEALIAFTIVLVAVEALVAPSGITLRGIGGAALLIGLLASVAAFTGAQLGTGVWLGLLLLTTGYLWLTRDADLARRLLPAVTTIFGLIHGFGFAGVLLELGLPQERLALALFSFNVGVEIGQIVFVAALWGVAMLAGPLISAPRQAGIRIAAASLLCLAGSYWFALRSFGG